MFTKYWHQLAVSHGLTLNSGAPSNSRIHTAEKVNAHCFSFLQVCERYPVCNPSYFLQAFYIHSSLISTYAITQVWKTITIFHDEKIKPATTDILSTDTNNVIIISYIYMYIIVYTSAQ